MSDEKEYYDQKEDLDRAGTDDDPRDKDFDLEYVKKVNQINMIL